MSYDSFIAPRATSQGLIELTQDEKDVILAERQAFVSKPDFAAVAKALENSFLGMLQTHVGQVYVTTQVKVDIWTAKPAITEALRAGALQDAKDILDSLALPTEMQSDQQALSAQLATIIGGL